MSWKATTYVKRLMRKDVTASEKLMLFVLADYHNARSAATWPSIPLLAAESFVTQRAAYQILARLEAKKIIERVSTSGKLNAYRFPDLDNESCSKVVSIDVNLSTSPERTPARNGSNP